MVGLGQHGGRRLAQDVVLGEFHHLLRHVDVADAGFGCRQVFVGNTQVVDGVVDTVLHRTEGRTLAGHPVDRQVDLTDRPVGQFVAGDLDVVYTQSRRTHVADTDADILFLVGADVQYHRAVGQVDEGFAGIGNTTCKCEGVGSGIPAGGYTGIGSKLDIHILMHNTDQIVVGQFDTRGHTGQLVSFGHVNIEVVVRSFLNRRQTQC